MSTRITILAATMKNSGQGKHTLKAEMFEQAFGRAGKMDEVKRQALLHQPNTCDPRRAGSIFTDGH